MDAGETEADIAFSAGADIVTAMAVAAADATIAGALDSARTHGKRLMVDMMQVAAPDEDASAGAGCNGLRFALPAHGARSASAFGIAFCAIGGIARGAASRLNWRSRVASTCPRWNGSCR